MKKPTFRERKYLFQSLTTSSNLTPKSQLFPPGMGHFLFSFSQPTPIVALFVTTHRGHILFDTWFLLWLEKSLSTLLAH